MRYLKLQNGQLIEGSLKSLLPHVSDPQVWSLEELAAVGVYTLSEPPPVEGFRWHPVTPTWDGSSLVGGWELQQLPPVVPEPDWEGFLAGFVFPGNEIYDGISTKVQAASSFTQEHWENLRMLIMMPSSLRTRESVIGGWNYLKLLLSADGQALTQETITAFESLAVAKHIILV